MKDPAVLFYPDNFMSGTMFFTDEQAGKYIRLLCAQHLTGHLSENHMIFICKSYDKDIFDKFIKDEDGKYYNIRLETEINKRRNYSMSRSVNKLGKKKEEKNKNHVKIISKSCENHMGNGNGNGNGNENEDKNVPENPLLVPNPSEKSKFQKPKISEVLEYCKERGSSVNAETFWNFYEAKGWKIGKVGMKNWKSCIKTWESSVSEKQKTVVSASQTLIANY